MAEVDIAIPGRPAYVRIVRLAVASLARSSGLEDEAIEDLKIAVGEACANAVLEAEPGAEGVKVRWSDEPERIVVEVGDSPAGRSPAVDAPTAVDSGGFSTRLVMSTALLESLVDECEVVNYEGGGIHARLVINRPPSL